MSVFARRIVAVVGLALLSSVVVAATSDWPQWRGANRENKSAYKGLRTDWDSNPPELLAQIKGMGAGYASVSVVGDRAYTTGNRDGAQCVIAVDLTKNDVAWVTPITEGVPKHGYDGSRTTPTVDGDFSVRRQLRRHVGLLEARQRQYRLEQGHEERMGRQDA
jgi:outer membrane protein assembly factor BamB